MLVASEQFVYTVLQWRLWSCATPPVGVYNNEQRCSSISAGLVGDTTVELVMSILLWDYIHCVSKTFPPVNSVTLSHLNNRFSEFLHCWRAYEICYKNP